MLYFGLPLLDHVPPCALSMENHGKVGGFVLDELVALLRRFADVLLAIKAPLRICTNSKSYVIFSHTAIAACVASVALM